jgi:hypothetical protein
MEVLHIECKEKMLNALRGYHIYRLTKQKLQMNETLTDIYNPIYDILIKTNPKRHNPTHSRNLNSTPTPILPYPPSTCSPYPFPSTIIHIQRKQAKTFKYIDLS